MNINPNNGQQTATASLLIQHAEEGARNVWLSFQQPDAVMSVAEPCDVPAALVEIEAAVARGWYAAGYLAYEAAPAFDEAFVTRNPTAHPVLWFGLYRQPEYLTAPPPASGEFVTGRWSSSMTKANYLAAIKRVKEYIAAGDTYQVNYTLRLRSSSHADPYALFTRLHRGQRGGYSAYLDLGDQVICSASPELFFRLEGDLITCRPMKGTAPRGLTWHEDEQQAAELQASAKNRAENVMIVDMIRNDLGRIAQTGSVHVDRLFEIERFPTVLQMTSTVTAATTAPVHELFHALFPCASITGAPKVRTMQIIAELENDPRGIYTGCIGWWGPGRRAQFNVAIRTVQIDRPTGQVEYGVGGGIVWDSVDRDEYRECQIKAHVLSVQRPDFRLLETLLWIPDRGYFLLDRHLNRLRNSARYFGFTIDTDEIVKRLEEATATLPHQRHRVRLLVDENGEIVIESYPLERTRPRRPWKIALAESPVDSRDRFLYHKTTHRAIYEGARATRPGYDDVILWNERGEVTEGTLANVVIRVGKELITPPVSSGLLPGAFREALLARGSIREELITVDDLKRADAIYLINSVRGWIPAEWG